MARETDIPTPPIDLVENGQNWALGKFAEEHHELISQYLRQSFLVSTGLFRKHRNSIIEEIKVRDGIDNVTQRIGSAGKNGLVCGDGIALSISDLLTKPVERQRIGSKGITSQDHVIDVLFGGPNIGIPPVNATDMDYKTILAPSPVHTFFTPEFVPAEIVIRDSVITRHGGIEKVTSHHYGVSAEGLPAVHIDTTTKPQEDPWAYRTPSHDVANPMSVNFLNDSGTANHIDRFGYLEEKPEDAVKILTRLRRYVDLLEYCQNRIMGIPSFQTSEVAVIKGLILPNTNQDKV